MNSVSWSCSPLPPRNSKESKSCHVALASEAGRAEESLHWSANPIDFAIKYLPWTGSPSEIVKLVALHRTANNSATILKKYFLSFLCYCRLTIFYETWKYGLVSINQQLYFCRKIFSHPRCGHIIKEYLYLKNKYAYIKDLR